MAEIRFAAPSRGVRFAKTHIRFNLYNYGRIIVNTEDSGGYTVKLNDLILAIILLESKVLIIPKLTEKNSNTEKISQSLFRKLIHQKVFGR